MHAIAQWLPILFHINDQQSRIMCEKSEVRVLPT